MPSRRAPCKPCTLPDVILLRINTDKRRGLLPAVRGWRTSMLNIPVTLVGDGIVAGEKAMVGGLKSTWYCTVTACPRFPALSTGRTTRFCKARSLEHVLVRSWITSGERLHAGDNVRHGTQVHGISTLRHFPPKAEEARIVIQKRKKRCT